MKSHVLATKLNSILTDNKFDRFVSGKKRGKLDFNSLSRVAYSDKVFKKKEARKNKEYKVIVLADASGSMLGTPADNVQRAMDFLNESLSKTDVDYAMWAFNADVVCLKDFSESSDKEVGKLYMDMLRRRRMVACLECGAMVGFYKGQGPDKCSCGVNLKQTMKEAEDDGSLRYGGAYRSDRAEVFRAWGWNADGLALHLAHEAIKKEGGHHIIVVLSDGQADAVRYNVGGYSGTIPSRFLTGDGILYKDMKLDKVVSKVEKDTILCSIGIQSDDVLQHYPKSNTEVIDDSEKVGEMLIKLISKQIKRG